MIQRIRPPNRGHAQVHFIYFNCDSIADLTKKFRKKLSVTIILLYHAQREIYCCLYIDIVPFSCN